MDLIDGILFVAICVQKAIITLCHRTRVSSGYCTHCEAMYRTRIGRMTFLSFISIANRRVIGFNPVGLRWILLVLAASCVLTLKCAFRWLYPRIDDTEFSVDGFRFCRTDCGLNLIFFATLISWPFNT